jgi:hypothetical protein
MPEIDNEGSEHFLEFVRRFIAADRNFHRLSPQTILGGAVPDLGERPSE